MFCVTQPDPEEELPRAVLGVLDVVLLEPEPIRWLTLVYAQKHVVRVPTLAVITLVSSSLVTRGPTVGAFSEERILTTEQDAVILASMNFLELQSHQTNNLLGLTCSPRYLIPLGKHISEHL
jgi:hypothetical protein